MNTYTEMNEKIVGLLGLSDEPMHLYAAQRIKELEQQVAQFQHPVPDEAGEVYVWVKASERLPTDKDGKESSGKVFIRNTHTNLGMMWPIWEIEEMCDLPNIEWLSPALPSGEDAGKGWISVEKENMPLETDLIVKHPFGVEAIHFFNAEWTFWYTGKSCGSDLIKSITHWQKP